MNIKDRSMICRMAGNIAGAVVVARPDKTKNALAKLSVSLAIAIVEEVDRKLADPCKERCGE